MFVTGQTGFKGAWLCHILAGAGAQVIGYALKPAGVPNLYDLCGAEERITSLIGDIRDLRSLEAVFRQARPEIVFHLAAQPLVRDSYANPVETYETNVMGTANLLECVRRVGGVKSLVNVTTDKVYRNNEWPWGYRETDVLDGYDPYANSKSCSELVTGSYRNSFLREAGVAVSTARSGNVIGGGDFAADRIIPDCVRAAMENKVIFLRHPDSVRPYQHVLEALFAYLLIAERQYGDPSLAGGYNIGPEDADSVTTGALAELFCEAWGGGLTWQSGRSEGPHEDVLLKLDNAKLKSTLGWAPRWPAQGAVAKTVEWTKSWLAGESVEVVMDRQVQAYLGEGARDCRLRTVTI